MEQSGRVTITLYIWAVHTHFSWGICLFVHSRFIRHLPGHFLHSDFSLYFDSQISYHKNYSLRSSDETPNYVARPHVCPLLSCPGTSRDQGPSSRGSGHSAMPVLLLTGRQSLWCPCLLSTCITKRFQFTLKSHLSVIFHQYQFL